MAVYKGSRTGASSPLTWLFEDRYMHATVPCDYVPPSVPEHMGTNKVLGVLSPPTFGSSINT